MKFYTAILSLAILLSSCSNANTQIAENTFIHGSKIYKLIDNEIREIGDLSDNNIKKFEVSKPKQRDLGTSTLSFVRQGAYTTLTALYRGNFLYYNLKVQGLNDLRERYSSNGEITIQFIDEFGFILHSTKIAISELTRVIGENDKTLYFVYSGKTEMSTEINLAITKYEVSAGLSPKSYLNY